MNETRDIVSYLAQTVQLGGSDLHLSAGAPPAARVGEQLTPLEDFLLDQESVENLIQQTLSESQRAVLEETWELDYAVHVDQVGRFRGNVHMVGHQEQRVEFDAVFFDHGFDLSRNGVPDRSIQQRFAIPGCPNDVVVQSPGGQERLTIPYRSPGRFCRIGWGRRFMYVWMIT